MKRYLLIIKSLLRNKILNSYFYDLNHINSVSLYRFAFMTVRITNFAKSFKSQISGTHLPIKNNDK